MEICVICGKEFKQNSGNQKTCGLKCGNINNKEIKKEYDRKRYLEKRDKKFIKKYQGKYFCKCGCGGVIIIKPFHKDYSIPNYITGHNSKEFQNRPEEKERVSKFMTEFQNRPEEKKASRKRNTGIKNPAFGVHRCGKDAPMFGKHQSDYQKRRVSEVHTGKIVSEKTKKKQRISTFEYAKKTNNILYPRIGNA